MDQILSRPEIQSAVIPFFCGLILFAGFRKLTTSAWLWAILGAFLVSAGLINGLTITPLTGTRKIILVILMSFFVAGLTHHLIASVKQRKAVMVALGISALLWVFWKVFIRMQAPEMATFLAGSVTLVLWLLWSFDRLGNNEVRLHSAGVSTLLGCGLCAVAGASALLGQLALSIATASGGVLLTWVILGNSGRTGQEVKVLPTLPYALAAALIGLAAVIFARVPWYALIPLASIPLITGFVPKISNTRFTIALITSLPGLTVALAIAFTVWQSGSSSSGY